MVVKDFENLVETKHGTMLPVQVKAGYKQFAIAGLEEGSLKVRLHSKPEKEKANQELVKELRHFFGAKVEIIKGKKTRQKRLLVHAEKNRVQKSLSSLQRQKA